MVVTLTIVACLVADPRQCERDHMVVETADGCTAKAQPMVAAELEREGLRLVRFDCREGERS